MANVLAIGRLDGRPVYQFGPKSFSLDFDSVFTALEVDSLLTRLPRAPISKRSTLHATKVGHAAQTLKREMLIDELRSTLLDLDHVLIARETVHLVSCSDLAAEFTRFKFAEREPVLVLTECLSKLGLEKWGILAQICQATAGFEDSDSESDGKRSMNFTFVI